jgi:hypothetical protein
MLGRLAIGAVIMLLSCLAGGQGPPCTEEESRRSDEEAGSLRSWDALYQSYKRYGRCDNASAAEGYSESVARILVDHWAAVSRLAKLAGRDLGFRRFVLSHIDATLDMKDVRTIAAKATKSCPPGLHSLCIDLKKSANAAIKEDAGYNQKSNQN